MASYHAIAATGEAILGLLEAACPKTEFPSAEFALYQPSDFQEPIREGISLYLYRVSINTSRRSLPPRLDRNGRRYKASLPVDLSYALTAWATSAARQQRLLGWAMRTMQDTPILPAGLLNHYGPEAQTFGPSESVELFCESLTLQDSVNLWEAFKPHPQLSVAYIARLILLDSELEMPEGAPVQTREFDFAKAGL